MSEVTNEQIIKALAAKKEEIIQKFVNDAEIVMSVEDHWSFDHICVVLDHSIKILSTPLDSVTELSSSDFADNSPETETVSDKVEGFVDDGEPTSDDVTLSYGNTEVVPDDEVDPKPLED